MGYGLPGCCPNIFCPDLETAGTGYLFLGQVKVHRAGKRQDVRNHPGQAHVDTGTVL
jgi:hypothetical protein